MRKKRIFALIGLSVVRKGKAGGFTLIELLVVISIIALLVAILMPTLSRAKELTRRAVCTSNLHAIGRAVYIYGNNNDLSIPSFDAGTDNRVDHVGYQYNQEDGTLGNHGNCRGWFALPKGGYCPLETFRCPSDDKARKMDYSLSGVYDFKPKLNKPPLNYALQVTKTWNAGTDGIAINLSDDGGMPIGADANGLIYWPSGSLTNGYAQAYRNPDVVADENEPEQMNSPNHGREGQNVLFLRGSAAWQTTPLCGIDNDNIWTKADGSAIGLDGSGDMRIGPPQDEEDSYLMP